MLIVGDDTVKNAAVRWPWITIGLIGLNLLAFAMQAVMGDDLTDGCSMTPKEIITGKDIVKPQTITIQVEEYERDEDDLPVFDDKGRVKKRIVDEKLEIPHAPGPFPIYMTLFTCMFLHAGFAHLLGNMWFLAVFGKNVERILGHGWFLLLYFACGLAANFAHIMGDTNSIIPCLGASGAISGIMGAYVCLFPLNNVKVWMGWFIGVVEVPAVVILGIWGLLQYVEGYFEMANPSPGGGVAYWAHLGGFAMGLLSIALVIYLAHVMPKREVKLTEAEIEAAKKAAAAAAAAAPPKPLDLGGWKPPKLEETPSRVKLSTMAYFQTDKIFGETESRNSL